MKIRGRNSMEALPGEGSLRGTVYLVGAGPGDPGLLTLRAARLLRRADVVIHDALVGERILDLVSPEAEQIDVGKRYGGRHTPQERINELLIEWAHAARRVVRLKGGDPFVYGRGAEEALALAAAGVRFEVVPGVTAAVGVGAYAGIPLTHRGLASSVTFVTGHEEVCPGRGRVDWDTLARLEGTLAIYMGVGGLESIAARLIRGGRSPATPAAVVEWGTHARQRTVVAPLDEIADVAQANEIAAPALVVVGEVAALREQLAWFDRLPLRGARILVGRSRPQPSRLVRAFRRLGADVAEYPRLRAAAGTSAAAVDRALGDLDTYNWIFFTSPAGVAHFWREARARGLDARCLAGTRVAAFGAATATALSRHGIAADFAARTFHPATIAAQLKRFGPLDECRVLFPREAHRGSPVAADLRAEGAQIDEVEIFRVEIDPGPGAGASPLEIANAEIVVLPSSTAAQAIAHAVAERPLAAHFVAIGPSTAQTALAHGLPVHAVAEDHSVDGVVRAVLELRARGAGSPESPRIAAHGASGASL